MSNKAREREKEREEIKSNIISCPSSILKVTFKREAAKVLRDTYILSIRETAARQPALKDCFQSKIFSQRKRERNKRAHFTRVISDLFYFFGGTSVFSGQCHAMLSSRLAVKYILFSLSVVNYISLTTRNLSSRELFE